MTFKAVRFALLASLLALPALVAAAPRHPVAVGTFIQWYLARDWTDAQWQAEFGRMREVGMSYLVFAPTFEGNDQKAYYPTRIAGAKEAPGAGHLVEACLRNAEKAGIRVFLGLNFHEDWWKKSARDPAWLLGQMDIGNQVADELFALYARKYPRAFHGWYWVWEVDNYNFRRPEHIATLAQALDRNVRHLHQLAPRMPVMLCPFMNAAVGGVNDYAAMWQALLQQCSLGKGDIFCPQDSVGAGGLKLEQAPAWFAALRKVVDTKPGLRFWSDTETFDQKDWTSAPLSRFVAQMRAVQPYVQCCLTFAYAHYYSPCGSPEGFHETYRGYVRTGALEATPPTPPLNVRLEKRGDGAVLLKWDAATDNIGVCGYRVYRDGAQVGHTQAHGVGRPQAPCEWTDKAPPAGAPAAYEVEAYDFAGNPSSRTRMAPAAP